MPWLEDLTSALGVPAGAATLAVAMYSGCVAAEKVARPEALSEISEILRDPFWTGWVRPAYLVQKIFVWTFGEHHFSLKCVVRSISATTFLVTAISLTIYLKTGLYPTDIRLFAYDALFIGLIPDYIALLKTRIIIRLSISRVILVVVDIILSLATSLLCFMVFDPVYVIITYGVHSIYDALHRFGQY
jgi:hypothetical protein